MSCSIKTARNGNTLWEFVVFRVPNTSSAMVLIKQFTIVILHNAVKLTKKLTPQVRDKEG